MIVAGYASAVGFVCSLSIGIGAYGPAALAQGTSAQIEEIVVTARKRTESIYETPMSITAFTSEGMERLGMTGINDIALRTPGLQYGNFGDQKLSPISLRGIVGTAGSAGADPAVGIYVDEVFVGQGAGASFDLFDIERVEVLRGPQGTLFGRNTIGGVISLTTKRPTNEFEAAAEAGYGNYDKFRLGGSINGPVVMDKVSAKLAVVHDKRGGTHRNLALNQRVNTNESWSVRGQVLLTPNDTTSLLLSVERREVDQEQLVFETLRYDEDALLPQLLDAMNLPRNTDPFDRDTFADAVPEERLNLTGYSATLNTSVGAVDVTSITAYREHDYFSHTDTDRSALRMLYDGDPEDVWRFSEELRASGSVGDLEWLTGIYYFKQRTSNQSFVEIGADLADLLQEPSIAGLIAGSDGTLRTESVAGFSSFTWNFTSRFDATVGARFTRESKEIEYVQTDAVGLLGGDIELPNTEENWSKFTPNLGLRFLISDDTLLYAATGMGFRSGGFNDGLGSADGIAFDPETVINYEVGLKSSFWDRRIVTSVSGYYMDWKDIQLTVDNPDTAAFDPIILNAGKAHSMGLEGEIQALLTDRFRVGLNLALQEAEYDEGTLPTGEPLDRIPFAPTYTAASHAEYVAPIAGLGTLSILGEVIARGSSYLTTDNEPDGRVDDYTLMNLRANLESPDGRWAITIWGNNLTDKAVKQRLFDLSPITFVGQKFIVLNDPRTYGVTVRLSF